MKNVSDGPFFNRQFCSGMEVIMENGLNRNNGEIEIDLGELFLALVGKLPLMAAAGLFVALAVFLAAKFGMTPSYQSTTRIYVLAKQDNAMVTYNDLQTGTQLTKDYAELICSRFVLEEVIEQLGLSLNYEQLKANVSVSSPSDTRIIAIAVTDSDPVRAMETANAVREAATVHIQNVMDIEAVNVVETADLPTVKSGPAVGRMTVLGGAFGVFLVAAVVVITVLFNDRIRTTEDVERYLNLSTLAVIPLNEADRKKKKRVRRR